MHLHRDYDCKGTVISKSASIGLGSYFAVRSILAHVWHIHDTAMHLHRDYDCKGTVISKSASIGLGSYFAVRYENVGCSDAGKFRWLFSKQGLQKGNTVFSENASVSEPCVIL